MMKVICLNCGRPYPESGVPYHCPSCGGLYDDVEPLIVGPADPTRPGLWRYAASLGIQAEPVSLGEGNTPLVAARAFGRDVFFKCEYANPTGSFKDRGSAILMSLLVSRGVAEAIEDSSGNAGASFAAYAARAGIRARVFVPESASGPKRRQIEFYGAELVAVPGPRSKAAQAVAQAADRGAVYASHAHLPFNLHGYATCAFELVEQLGVSPGSVLLPAGQGGLLLGMARGFEALVRAGKIEQMPVMLATQASACAPLVALAKMGVVGLSFVTEAPTLAEGVRIRTPLRAEAVIRMMQANGGRFVSVDEDDILPGRDALARLGFYVEPTSALIWRALEENIAGLPDPVVAILTGSGYKVRLP